MALSRITLSLTVPGVETACELAPSITTLLMFCQGPIAQVPLQPLPDTSMRALVKLRGHELHTPSTPLVKHPVMFHPSLSVEQDPLLVVSTPRSQEPVQLRVWSSPVITTPL